MAVMCSREICMHTHGRQKHYSSLERPTVPVLSQYGEAQSATNSEISLQIMADDLFTFDMHDDGLTCEEEEDEGHCEDEQVRQLSVRYSIKNMNEGGHLDHTLYTYCSTVTC